MGKKKILKPAFDVDIGSLVHAGQDFVDGHAWITFPYYGRVDGEDDLEMGCFYLNDEGRVVHANEMVDGLRFLDVIYPEERWKHEDMLGWINGGRNFPTLKELVEQVASLFTKYAEYVHPFEPKFFALWSIATYFHQLFDSFPMIFLTGIMGTGKSRTGKIMAFTSFNGCLSPNVSPAVMFRQIDEEKCTFIVDEKESFGEAAKEMKDKDMESVMNGGDKKGALVERCELDLATKKMRPRKFEVYSPKMIVNVAGQLASNTMRNRCISVTMMRALHDVSIDEPDAKNTEFVNVRCGLYRYMLAKWKDVQKAYLESDFKGNRRAVTIWKPLVVLAEMIDEGTKQALFDYMKIRLKEAEFDEDETEEVKILYRLFDIVKEKRDYTFGELSGYGGMDLHWQDYSDRKFGLMLKKLGFTDKRHSRTGAIYVLSPEKVAYEMKRMGIGVVKEVNTGIVEPNIACDTSGGSVLSVTASQASQASRIGDGCDGCDAVTDKNIPPDASLRPPEQTSLSEVNNDNKGSLSQIDEVPSDNNGTLAPSEQNPEPSGLFPDVEWFLTGICSSCGVNNQTTMHEGKQLCKLCYFELKSDELDKGENIDGSINPCSDSKEQEVR